MLKRHRSLLPEPRSSLDQIRGKGHMLKTHGSRVELLPDDVVELILERLPVKTLLRFKSVSKMWKSAIESRYLQEAQLIRRRKSRGPDVLFVSLSYYGDDGLNTDARRITFGSSIACTVRFPISGSMVCHGSCDGLLCLYYVYKPSVSVVINPATRWYRCFPLSRFQQLLCHNRAKRDFQGPNLGFGKDKFSGSYKPVWLYNSSKFGLDNATTCEVFDFNTNSWRYLLPASPYRINAYIHPVYFDGSLYWLTEETKVLSLDLHNETFQVFSKAPFAHLHDLRDVTMCILDNHLCVSEKNWPTQVIWSLDSLDGNNTWHILCSIDFTKTFSWFGEPKFPLSPIVILEKNKLLLQGRDGLEPLVIHDLHTNSYELLFKPTKPGFLWVLVVFSFLYFLLLLFVAGG